MQELMKCGHPKACLVEREITNIEKNEGPLNDTEYCLACVEREKVKEMCAEGVNDAIRVMEREPTMPETRAAAKMLHAIRNLILALDFTKPESDLVVSSREEKK